MTSGTALPASPAESWHGLHTSSASTPRTCFPAVIMRAPGTCPRRQNARPRETEVPAIAGTVHMPPNRRYGNENNSHRSHRPRHHLTEVSLAFNVAIMLLAFVAPEDQPLQRHHAQHLQTFAWGPRPHPASRLPWLHVLGSSRSPLSLGSSRHPLSANATSSGATSSAPAPSSTSSSPSASLARSKPPSPPRTFSIATFALYGFRQHVGSIGMQIGGIGALVPNRRNDLAQLGLRAMLAGTMANLSCPPASSRCSPSFSEPASNSSHNAEDSDP